MQMLIRAVQKKHGLTVDCYWGHGVIGELSCGGRPGSPWFALVDGRIRTSELADEANAGR